MSQMSVSNNINNFKQFKLFSSFSLPCSEIEINVHTRIFLEILLAANLEPLYSFQSIGEIFPLTIQLLNYNLCRVSLIYNIK